MIIAYISLFFNTKCPIFITKMSAYDIEKFILRWYNGIRKYKGDFIWKRNTVTVFIRPC